MTWHTNPAVVGLRTALRAAGLTRVVRKLAPQGRYEEQFDAALIAAIRPGDCVWDVGANVGHYTIKMCDRAGAAGRVFAFEPSSANRSQLAAALAGRGNVEIVASALGLQESSIFLVQGADEIGATSRVVDTTDVQAETVRISRADELVRRAAVAEPQVVKIDTEGYELDVLRGMGALLSSAQLRCVGVEIHFGLLAARGQAGAAREIDRLLAKSGLKPKWTDSSHVVASR